MKKVMFQNLPESYDQFCALPQLQDLTVPENKYKNLL